MNNAKAFWAKWKQLVVFFGLMLGFLIGMYFWTGYQSNQAIDPTYETYLHQVAEASPKAKGYRAAYLAHAQRDDVASKDFLLVCAGMVMAAKEEQVEVARFNANLTALCEDSAIYINHEFYGK